MALEIENRLDGLHLLRAKASNFDAEFMVSGSCPVQATGIVRGRDLYFRACHTEWTFEVADSSDNLPSDGYRNSDGYYREGKHVSAGHMSLEEAAKIIEECLRAYLESR